jgi:Protein of unknown function (DUF3592)
MGFIMKKGEFFGIGLFFLFGGLFMLVIGIWYTVDNDYYTLNNVGIRAEGKIIKYREAPEDESSDLMWLYNPVLYVLAASGIIDEMVLKSYYVSVQFEAKDNKIHTFRNKFVLELDVKSKDWRKVEIVYFPDNPDEAVVYDFFYFYGITLLLIIISLISFLLAYFGFKL